MNKTPSPWRPTELLKLLGVALLYGLASRMVLSYFSLEGEGNIFSLASGLALAALLLGGKRYAGAVAAGALVTNLLTGDLLWLASAKAAGVALSPLLGAWLIQRSSTFDTHLPKLKDLLQMGLGGFVGAAASALIVSTSLLFAGDLSHNTYLNSLINIWMGETLGIVLVTPLILVWWPTATNRTPRPSPQLLAEAVLILGLCGLVGGIVFLDWWHNRVPTWLHLWFSEVSQNYWLFLMITVAALRLGARGTSLALLLVALQGALGVSQSLNAFGGEFSAYHFSNYWFFITVLVWVGMTLSIYMEASKATTLSLIKRKEALSQELNNVIAAVDQHSIVAITDPQGRITSVNDRFCEISGYTRDELIGQNHRMLNSGLHPKAFFQDLYQTITAGQVWHGEVRNRAKDGSFYWMQTTIAPFLDDAGAVVKYVAIRTNITRRKQAEYELQLHRDHLRELVDTKTAALQQNERKLSEILESVDACIYVKDIEGRYLFANRPMCELVGVTQTDIIGQRDDQFFDATTCEKIQLNDREVLDQGKTVRAEETNINLKDGSTSTYLSVKIPLSNAAGDIYALCGISTDITERKRIEEAAHAANRAKSEFLANMSHEIRTPMNGVIGMLDVIQSTELTLPQRRMLDTIYNSSQVLLTILNDILDLSKIEAGKLAIESLPTHLRELAEELSQLIVTSSPSQSLDFFVFVDPDLPRSILIDPTRLRQILMNLLSNALKFIPTRENHTARVVLTVTPCELAPGLPGVRFCVTDNGIGISEQAQATLFQPFTQADSSTARRFGGTGLGLSISHRLVNLMGGNISVRSTLGEGAQFTVEMPLNEAPNSRMPVFDPRLDGMRVLALTQDAEVSQIISRYCTAAGAQVSVVATLAAAHQHLDGVEPAPGGTVLVIDRMATVNDPALNLPASVGLVLLDRSPNHSRLAQFIVTTRPLLHNDLIQGVGMANGRMIPPHVESLDDLRSVLPATPAPSIEVARATGRLILMAEDNETNRDVMQSQLHLLGYACETAEDGVAALKLWRTGRYALLLTDCHMPHMDGFELTEAIRQEEAPGTRLPIVAITANARPGEAEHCRTRGMDDYLTKPLRMKELGPMLAKWMPSATPGTIPDRGSALAVWDATTLPELVGDNPPLHRRLLEKFLINAQGQVTDIGVAAAAHEVSTVETLAHTLKSAARSVGALRLGECSQALEDAGHAGNVSSCSALAAGLPQALAEVQALINNHLVALETA